MPVRKPQGLKKRHDTAEEKSARISDELAMTPKRELPLSPPIQLKGHKIACSEWRNQIKLYNEMEAKIVSGLDRGILLDYCMAVEQLYEMYDMRTSALALWKSLNDVYNKVKESRGENNEIEYETVLHAAELLETAYDKITKLDARVDQKVKMIHTLRQSLYLTPRSRSAAVPTKKPMEEPESDMDKVLNYNPADFLHNPDAYVRNDKG